MNRNPIIDDEMCNCTENSYLIEYAIKKESNKKVYNNCFKENPTLIGNQIVRPNRPVFTPKEFLFLSESFPKITNIQNINNCSQISIEKNACND